MVDRLGRASGLFLNLFFSLTLPLFCLVFDLLRLAKKTNQFWEAYITSANNHSISHLPDFILAVEEEGKPIKILSLAFHPKKDIFASGHDNGTIWLWNWNSRTNNYVHTALSQPNRPLKAVKSLAFSPDGLKLASGSEDRTIRLWDLEYNGLVSAIKQVVFVTIPPIFDLIGLKTLKSKLYRLFHFWSNKSRRLGESVDMDTVNSIAFSPDGKYLISGGEDQTVRRWELASSKLVEELPGQYFGISSAAFDPHENGIWIAAGSWDNTVRLWNRSPKQVKPTIPQVDKNNDHDDSVMSVAYSPKSNMLASASWDKKVRLWKLDSPDQPEFYKVLKGHESRVWSVAFSPNGKILASSGTNNTDRGDPTEQDNKVRLWKIGNLEQDPIILDDAKNGVSSVAFSPNGEILAAGVWGNKDKCEDTVLLWDLSQVDESDWKEKKLKEKARSLKGHHKGSVTSVNFVENETLATCGDDGTINLWCLVDWQQKPPEEFKCILLGRHDDRVYSVAYSHEKQILASSSNDKTIKLWNLKDFDWEHRQLKRESIVLPGHLWWVGSVAFNKSGETLASASYDGTIRLWNLSSDSFLDWQKCEYKGNKPIVLRGHKQSVTSVVFITSNSGEELLASGSYDNTVRLWITSTEKLAKMVEEQVPRVLTEKEWERFIGSEMPYPYKTDS
jgi:WD40 repeat protein